MNIKLLGECPHLIPNLSQLWFDEIGKIWIPDASVERAMQHFENHTNLSSLPMTFVAMDGEQVVGMCSLRHDDGLGDEMTPWLGGLIVAPLYRGKGIGEQLVNVIKACAYQIGYDRLYLLTLDKTIPTWYSKLGWKTISENKLYHHEVKVMTIDL